MKKIFNYILLAISVSLVSCSLDIPQDDFILDDDVMQSVEDLNLVVIGAYAEMPTYGVIEVSSRISDDNRKAQSNRGQGVQIHTWSINSSTTEASDNWAARFRPILNANKLFEKVSSIKPKTAAEAVAMERYKAEAYAIRAYMHFELLRLYGDYTNLNSDLGIPYVVSSGIDFPSRKTVLETYDLIEKDLLDALSIMPESFTNKYRINKNAIKAMLSRLYLYKEDYSNAIKYSSELIDELELNNVNNYLALWSDLDDTELIFGLDKIPGDAAIGEMFTSSNGDIMFHPSYELINAVSVEPSDIRNKVIYQSREADSELVVAKYLGNETTPGLNDVKLFRLSEQYLIRAESYAQTNMLSEAAADYNELRKHRIPSYVNEAFNSQDLAIDKILKERRIELAFEGHRWYDLRRYELGVDRLDEDVELNSYAKELSASDAKFKYLPIPQDEIFANDNMKQNEGF